MFNRERKTGLCAPEREGFDPYAQPLDGGTHPVPVRSTQETLAWASLVSKIQRGDEAARRQFLDRHRSGARLLLRRALGPIGIEALAEETLLGALNEIRQGWIQSTGDLVQFLRGVIARHKEQRPPLAESRTAADLTRTNQNAQRLVAAVASLRGEERAAMEAYYAHGKSMEEALAETGLSRAEFERVRTSLRRELRGAELRKPASSEMHLGVRRAAAAGGR